MPKVETKFTGPYTGRFSCKWCDHSNAGAGKLRIHVRKYHPEVTAEELERHLVNTRYPDLDLDLLVSRYRDRLESLVGLQRKGIFVKKYLKTVGVLRFWRADLAIMQVLALYPDMETAEDVRQAMENTLIGKFRNASPEVRFEGYLNRENSILKKKGQEKLIPAITALKVIKFTKKQLEAALDESLKAAQAAPEDSPSPESGGD